MIQERDSRTGRGEEVKVHSLLLHDIHKEYTGCWAPGGKGLERGRHDSDDYLTMGIIFDAFALEQGAEVDPKGEKGKGREARTTEVEGAIEAMTAALWPDLLLQEGTALTHIWHLEGTLTGLDRAFSALFKALAYDPDDVTAAHALRIAEGKAEAGSAPERWMMGPSGDDDVFDYWPNTMDMLHDMAQNLDELDPIMDNGGMVNGHEREAAVIAMARRVRAATFSGENAHLIDEWAGARWLGEEA